MEILQEIV